MDIKNFYKGVIDFKEIVKIYATLDPSTKSANVSLTDGNLTINQNSTAHQGTATSNIAIISGKYYYELIYGVGVPNNQIKSVGAYNVNSYTVNNFTSAAPYSIAYYSYSGRLLYINGTDATVAFGLNLPILVAGDRVMIAVDMDNGKWYFGANGTWFKDYTGTTCNPSAGTNAIVSFTASDWGAYHAWSTDRNNGVSPYIHTSTMNFGQSSFSYSVPTGYKSGIYTEYS